MTYSLTTPLYYVNDRPHLGSTYTTIACDALARFQRLEGETVLFVTGVDEHGQKIQRTAAEQGIEPREHCDRITARYLEAWRQWGISNDRFVRTTEPRHRPLVQAFFQRCEAAGDIRSGRQTGWYCVGCEEFKDEPAEAKEPCCPLHQKPLEWRDEENLFFCLSHFQERIETLINQPGFIAPASRRKEIQNFVAGGLRDFSISRVNVAWGLPVPGHEGHTFYVWFDALLGYLTALLDDGGDVDLNRLGAAGWPADVQVIGKDILRFHAVYWPAMLMSAGLPVPKRVFGHGFLTREGQKMGKSLGNVLDPEVLLERCGADAVRWYLLRDIQFGDDGDFQQQRFTDLVNNDLANTIGNLLNRTASMARKWFNDAVPPIDSTASAGHALQADAEQTIERVRQAMPELHFQQACEAILSLAIQANGYLNAQAPWRQMKQPGNEASVASDLYAVLECCRLVGLLLQPLVPDLSQRILDQLGEAPVASTWKERLIWGKLRAGSPLTQPQPVMARLELDAPL
ncbi:methionine--tRNA ligase [Synechococcus sp. RS9909]|uniref:methionine--tRNA ligase n=1 Tax=unclassified Synechococcus TaxID=2626047 RepID=UPI000068F7E9|nr:MULTISPECIES: methionine--tRNA ligase [unclassified Synechococcus]EAQ69325.1 methionyl-tRNA synthetase [Synechococcus sp. RS9917]QNI79421.1 methionine--tRNA ligase [Synechococcus sp. RS9909]